MYNYIYIHIYASMLLFSLVFGFCSVEALAVAGAAAAPTPALLSAALGACEEGPEIPELGPKLRCLISSIHIYVYLYVYMYMMHICMYIFICISLEQGYCWPRLQTSSLPAIAEALEKGMFFES